MEMVCSFLSFDVVVEVDRCGSAAYLVGQYSQLVVYSLEASAAVAVVAECKTVSMPEERFVHAVLYTCCSF